MEVGAAETLPFTAKRKSIAANQRKGIRMTLDEYWDTVNSHFDEHKELRYGQAAFNVLGMVRPDLSYKICATANDPFYVTDYMSDTWINYCQYLENEWSKTLELPK